MGDFAQRDIRNGTRLEARGRDLRINGVGLPDELPPGVTALIEPSLDEEGAIIGQDSTAPTGDIYVCKGITRWTGWRFAASNAVGRKATAMGYGRRIFWQQNGLGLVTQDLDGLEPPAQVVGSEYQSGGIQDCRPDPLNQIIMWKGTTSTLYATRRDGSRLSMPSACRRGDRAVFYADSPYAEANGQGIQAYEFSTDTLWRVVNGDPLNFRVRLDDDGKTVALSGDWPIPFPTESEWTLEPPLPPPPDYAPFAPFTLAKFLGCYPNNGGHLAHENCSLELVPGAASGQFVTGAGTFPWYEVEQGRLQGIPPEQLLKNHPFGSVVSVGSRVLPDWASTLMKPGEAVAAWFYLDHGEDPAVLLSAIATFVSRANQAGLRAVIIGQGWNRGQCTDAETHTAMSMAHHAVQTMPGAMAAIWFGVKRGTTLGQWKPLYGDWLDQMSSPAGQPVYPAGGPPPDPKPPTPQPAADQTALLLRRRT